MRLSYNVVEKLRCDAFMKSEIVRVTGRSYPTILRWLSQNDEMLTLRSVIDLIKKRYGLKDRELFTSADLATKH